MVFGSIKDKYGVFVEQDGTRKVLTRTGLNLVGSVLHACDTETEIHPLAQFEQDSTYKEPSTCRCGKMGCHNMARIKNIFTGVVVDSIGSVCIETQFDYNHIRTWIRSERAKDAKEKRDALKIQMSKYGERVYNGKKLNDFVEFEKKVKRELPEYETKMERLIKWIKDEELKKYFKYSIKNKIQ